MFDQQSNKNRPRSILPVVRNAKQQIRLAAAPILHQEFARQCLDALEVESVHKLRRDLSNELTQMRRMRHQLPNRPIGKVA